LPAGGAGSALLSNRKEQTAENIQEFKASFGTGRRAYRPISEKDFEDRRQKQRKALLASS